MGSIPIASTNSFGEGRMTNVATYKNIGIDVPEDHQYLAYVVLPTGDFWHVRFNGPTADIAKEKAIYRWTKENAKWERLGLNKSEPEEEDEAPSEPASGRGHHFAGKVWMRNGETLKRVALTEIALYEKNGFVRGKKL